MLSFGQISSVLAPPQTSVEFPPLAGALRLPLVCFQFIVGSRGCAPIAGKTVGSIISEAFNCCLDLPCGRVRRHSSPLFRLLRTSWCYATQRKKKDEFISVTSCRLELRSLYDIFCNRLVRTFSPYLTYLAAIA